MSRKLVKIDKLTEHERANHSKTTKQELALNWNDLCTAFSYQRFKVLNFCMKKFIVYVSIALGILACNQKKPSADSVANNPIINKGGSATDSANDGERLIAAGDCFTCHSINKTNVGPAFIDIAKKYPNGTGTAENLARSIVSGSKGIWGNSKAMVPHPNISFQAATKMAEYILSLREQQYEDSLAR